MHSFYRFLTASQSDFIPLLVSHGGDLEARDGDGLRPIHYAAKAGKHATLLSLLVAGAHPGTVTPRRWNALHYAVAFGHSDAVRLLAWWDSDSGALLRQKNSAGVTPRDLSRYFLCRRVKFNHWLTSCKSAELASR